MKRDNSGESVNNKMYFEIPEILSKEVFLYKSFVFLLLKMDLLYRSMSLFGNLQTALLYYGSLV